MSKSPQKKVSPLDLELDPYNPRLTLEEEGSSQDKLIGIILAKFKLEELAESIISAGYLPFDPIIAVYQGDRLVVLEGNRRIATLKLLLDPSLAPVRYRKRWQDLSHALSPETKQSIEQVDVQVYPSRQSPELDAYIGFRHVTGVLQWPALEKASFISHLVDRGWSYKKIAERMGSYPKVVEKHYVGFKLVEQARELGLPGSDRLADTFGVLMRALQTPGVLSFIGITFPGDPELSRRPVSEERIQNFSDFIEWTFGTNEKNRLISDSRQLTKWGKILSATEAVSYLRRSSSPSFERAWFKSGGESESLMDSLLRAADSLEESIPLVPLHRDEQEVRGAVERCTQFLLQIMRDFPDLKNEYGIKGNV